MMFLILLTLISAEPRDKVVYGNDDRIDLYDAENSNLKNIAKSTAAFIPSSASLVNTVNSFTSSSPEVFPLNNPPSLNDQIISSYGKALCTNEKFKNQPTAAICTGFLVTPDIIITAGHCIDGFYNCSNSIWVFDYNYTSYNDAINNNPINLAAKNMYTCEVISSENEELAGGLIEKDDYAILRLNRKVKDRNPLKVRQSGKVANNTDLYLIGNPSGIPTKIAANAKVKDTNISQTLFLTNTDSFAGNSGSPVFNQNTNLVEGILVLGQNDYEVDSDNDCITTAKLYDNQPGEFVYRITNTDPNFNISIPQKISELEYE